MAPHSRMRGPDRTLGRRQVRGPREGPDGDRHAYLFGVFGAAALRLAERFDEVAQNLPTAVATPLDLVPFQPGRLYEREQVGPYQATLVHHGWTPNLSTPVPQNVEADSADGIRWMTDIDVSEWMSIRHRHSADEF
jgi:hypothetical protein